MKQEIKVVKMIDGNPQYETCVLSDDIPFGSGFACKVLPGELINPTNPPSECRIRNGNSVLVIGEDSVGIEHGGMERI